MRRTAPWVGLLVLASLLPAFAADDQDDPPAKTTAKHKKDSKPLTSGKTLKGKLINLEGSQRYLTVQVTNKIPQQNAQAAQQLANLQQQIAVARARRDVNQINNLTIEMAKHQRNLVTYKDDVQKYELEAPEDMKVRTMLLPVEYDDKGKPRALTDKEKKALKGPDPKLPGYDADFESLKNDQTVEVYLIKSKDSPKPKTKDKDGDLVDDTSDKPKIAMIVILAEAKK